MNSVCILGNALQKSLTPFLSTPRVLSQQTRNTFILKRRNPPPLHKANQLPKRLKQRNFIYDLVENTDVRKKQPLEVILTSYVKNIGDRGDKVSLKPMRAYNELLLPGIAVYATPENIKKYRTDNNDTSNKWSSPYAARTVDILSKYLLNVVMSYNNPWTLEKWHVKSAFRKAGIHILDDDCIQLPDREIKGPNIAIENKEFYVTVTINKKEQVKVRCRIHHWTNNKSIEIPVVTDFYKKPSEPIFPEDQKILDEMPMPYLMSLALKQNEEIQKTE